MCPMRVEQAIFTSARTSKLKGYHLVARSPGIQDDSTRALIRWGPSHASLTSSDLEASSFNFHPAGTRGVAISRPVYGGAEYSARGSLQLVTRTLILRPEQLQGYDNDPLAVARVAMALGYLMFEPDAPEHLPALDLPARSLFALP